MKIKLLLTLIAALEIGTGAGLLLAPSTVTGLLLGGPLESAIALIVARVAGLALISIALACWFERSANRGGAPTALLIGLLVYNAAVPVVLIQAFVVQHIGGIGLWPATVVHLVFAGWIVACLRRA